MMTVEEAKAACMYYVLTEDRSKYNALNAAVHLACFAKGVSFENSLAHVLGGDGYTDWLTQSVRENCAQALAWYAESYPEGDNNAPAR